MNDKIIANGQRQILDSEAFKLQEIEIIQKTREKYQAELKHVGFWKRLLIRYRMNREIEAELDKIAPKYGLYLSAGKF